MIYQFINVNVRLKLGSGLDHLRLTDECSTSKRVREMFERERERKRARSSKDRDNSAMSGFG